MSHSTQNSETNLTQVAVLIPAWKPERNIVSLVDALIGLGMQTLLVVDDGSGPEFESIFQELKTRREVHLLRHAVNLGKGRALKTGFNYFLNELPAFTGIITADADGQHLPQDIAHVAQTFIASSNKVTLGTRVFSKDVPLRSKFGNVLTRYIFAFVTGTKIADTQTGLRAIPRALLPELMLLDGERYEYEMTMLAQVCRQGATPAQVPIATVYIDGNRSSHFNPIWDSMRIYFVLARFYASSLFAAGIDLAGFSLVFAATGNILLSLLVGRLSSLVNFALNRRFVFHNRGPVASALWRYYALVLFVTGLSYGMIRLLTQHAHWNVYATKIGVDIVLSLVSFSVQRALVFRRGEKL